MNKDLQSNETRQQEAQALIQRYIQLFVEKDIEGWMSLWDEHGVLELPFAPQGRPSRVEGKAALYPYIQRIIHNMEILGFSQQQVYATLDPDLIIVETGGEGRAISTGLTYNARYVWVMRTKNGKLIHVRDYWNPLATLEAGGGLDAAKQNSKVSEQEQR
jgi:Ketosteroid isomerase-related protein